MARIPRILITGEPTAYHVISRTALDGLPMGDVEKDFFVGLVKRFSSMYFVKILGFCCMGNHFHLLVRMLEDSEFSDEDIKARFQAFYGEERRLEDGQIPSLRVKWASLSEFVREIKQRFARFYNKRHDRKGYFWGDRFKSVVVEKGETLINCLAYIDLNPVRAGIVERPEDYRWSSIGYHVQSGNRDGFLSTDFGLREFGEMSTEERFRQYRKFVYEIGGKERDGAAVIDPEVLAKERENEYRISLSLRLLHRTRYFTDSGIIGSKAFVTEKYSQVKHQFQAKRDRIPKPIDGLEGVFSLKRIIVQ